MKHPTLRSYLDTLLSEKELHIIEEEVDPCLELAEIQRRVVAGQGPALLFTRVRGTRFPVVTNMFGTRRRIEIAFGEDPARFIRRLAQAAERLVPARLTDLFQFRDLAKTALRLAPRKCRAGPVLDNIVQPPRLQDLPQVKSWPDDGGPFLTLPLVYTEHPLTGKGNLGMYRNQIYDDRTLGMHFQIHRGGGFHYHAAEQTGHALPANLLLGGPPALILSAIAPLPENVPELTLASLLQGGQLHVVRDPKISPLPVVAESDFALIGRIPPGVRRLEGPFGDHYGYYSLAHEYPVFEVEKMCYRKNAIFPATVVGRPRQEDHYIGEYLQDLFAPVFPLVLNGVLKVWAYDDAGVHPLAAAVVRERYRKEAFMAALRILGEGQLSLTKVLIATDAVVDLREFRKVLVHVLARADFATDLFVFSNVSQDTLDYSSRTLNEGSKAVLLGLGEARYALAAEPREALRNPRFRSQAVYAPGVLVVSGPAWREGDDAVAQLLEEPGVQPFRLVCLVDDAEDAVRDDASFLWTIFTRFEPAADLHSRSATVRRYHVQFTAPLVFDCRVKPWYPPLVAPHPETIARVDALWPKIF